jgi:hypothetical protein
MVRIEVGSLCRSNSGPREDLRQWVLFAVSKAQALGWRSAINWGKNNSIGFTWMLSLRCPCACLELAGWVHFLGPCVTHLLGQAGEDSGNGPACDCPLGAFSGWHFPVPHPTFPNWSKTRGICWDYFHVGRRAQRCTEIHSIGTGNWQSTTGSRHSGRRSGHLSYTKLPVAK